MSEGYVRLYRKTLESAAWQTGPITRSVFFWLLMSVNYKEGHTASGVAVGPGEIITTYQTIADGVSCPHTPKVTIKQVRHSIDRLTLSQVVVKIGSAHGQGKQPTYLHLKLLHWSKYQAAEEADLGQGLGQPMGSQGAAIEEGNKGRNATNVAPGNGYVAQWVNAEREAGRNPAPNLAAIFGAKAKAVGEIDPLIMADAIKRMVAEERHPAFLGCAYTDAKRIAEKEIFEMQTGRRQNRVR
jgi:hypothetical protein